MGYLYNFRRFSKAFLDRSGVFTQTAGWGGERPAERQSPACVALSSALLSGAAKSRQEHGQRTVDYRSQFESIDAVQGSARQVRVGLGERRKSKSSPKLQQKLHRQFQKSARYNRQHSRRRPAGRQGNRLTRFFFFFKIRFAIFSIGLFWPELFILIIIRWLIPKPKKIQTFTNFAWNSFLWLSIDD